MHTFEVPKDREIEMFLEFELSPDEKKVYDLVRSENATQGRTGLMARSLGWSDAKVSRLRKSIEGKVKRVRTALA